MTERERRTFWTATDAKPRGNLLLLPSGSSFLRPRNEVVNAYTSLYKVGAAEEQGVRSMEEFAKT